METKKEYPAFSFDAFSYVQDGKGGMELAVLCHELGTNRQFSLTGPEILMLLQENFEALKKIIVPFFQEAMISIKDAILANKDNEIFKEPVPDTKKTWEKRKNDIQLRNISMLMQVLHGKSLEEVAQRSGISKSSVAQANFYLFLKLRHPRYEEEQFVDVEPIPSKEDYFGPMAAYRKHKLFWINRLEHYRKQQILLRSQLD